jgi:Tfp pilus assembly protein PilZ
MLELDYARRCERREVNILCDLVARNWDEPIPYRITDLSAHGMWIQTSFPLDVGETAVLSLVPPNRADEVQVFARVVRTVRVVERNGKRECGMGLELVGMDGVERRALRRSLRGLPVARRRVSRVPLLDI